MDDVLVLTADGELARFLGGAAGASAMGMLSGLPCHDHDQRDYRDDKRGPGHEYCLPSGHRDGFR